MNNGAGEQDQVINEFIGEVFSYECHQAQILQAEFLNFFQTPEKKTILARLVFILREPFCWDGGSPWFLKRLQKIVAQIPVCNGDGSNHPNDPERERMRLYLRRFHGGAHVHRIVRSSKSYRARVDAKKSTYAIIWLYFLCNRKKGSGFFPPRVLRLFEFVMESQKHVWNVSIFVAGMFRF